MFSTAAATIAIVAPIISNHNHLLHDDDDNGNVNGDDNNMHQVLSYETAMRANSSREFREFVSKRTCVSLLLTIAFLTLICGYLLGNFVAERKYQIKERIAKRNDHKSIDISSDEYDSLKEIQSYHKSKELLLATAQKLSKLRHKDENYLPSSLNAEIFNKYISCSQEIPPNNNIESSQFIEQLVDNTSARQRDCLRIIQVILDSNLANG